MVILSQHTKQLFINGLLFLLAAIASIVYQEPLLLIIPFLVLLVPICAMHALAHTHKWYYWLFVLIPLSTELSITPTLGIDFPDEVFLLILTAIAILKWIHQPNQFPLAVKRSPLFLLLVLHLVWIAITCLYAVDGLPALKFLLAKIWYIIPFVVLPSVLLYTPLQLQRMALALLVSMGVVVVITLARHGWDGFGFISINRHLFPFFRNHVNYAAMLVCLLPVAIGVYHLTPALHPKKRWLFYCICLAVLALLLSYSRGAWLAAVAGGLTIWMIRKKLTAFFVFASFSAVLLTTIWLVTDNRYFRFAPDHDRTIFHTNFGDHLSATVAFKDISNAERFYRWVAGARMFADRPVTGFGPASFYNHYRPYTVASFETWVSNNPEHSTVHNYFLLTALEQGLVGLVVFLLLFVAMLLRLQWLYHRLQNDFYQTVALITAVVLVMIGVINAMSDMIETDKIGSLFWLCMGMTMVLENQLATEKASIA